MSYNNASEMSYDSVREVRYFCEQGGPSIEGSTPISHQPITQTNEDFMYAIRNKSGLYLTEDGRYVSACEIHKIKWFKWYLEAEESTCGTSNVVVGAMTMLELIVKEKDLEIAELKIKLDKACQGESPPVNIHIITQ